VPDATHPPARWRQPLSKSRSPSGPSMLLVRRNGDRSRTLASPIVAGEDVQLDVCKAARPARKGVPTTSTCAARKARYKALTNLPRGRG
jgi:hypothetical protein